MKELHKNIIDLYITGMPVKEIANSLGCHKALVSYVANKNGLRRRNGCNIKDEVIKDYNEGKSMTEIAETFNISHASVSYILHQNNVKIRSRSEANQQSDLNVNIFSEMTNRGAYWLGLIASDGNLSDADKTKTYRVTISLQQQDSYLIEEFKKDLNSKNKLMTRNNQIEFKINNEKIYKDLLHYNMTPRKSLTLKFPTNLDEKYISHFVRGVFDGDGSIYFDKKTKNIKPRFSICGSLDLLEHIQNYMIEELGINKTKIRQKGNIYEIRYGGREAIKKIAKWMYQDSEIYMKRKKEKFDLID